MTIKTGKGYNPTDNRSQGTSPNVGSGVPNLKNTIDNEYTYYNLLDARTTAQGIDKNLRSDDLRFNRAVMVIHGDGTSLFYQNGFAELHGDWWMIFSEHHPCQVYHREDLLKLMQYERIDAESYENFD